MAADRAVPAAGSRRPPARLLSGKGEEEVGRDVGAGSANAELRTVLRLGWPNSVNLFLTFLPGLVMLHFLGSNADHAAAAGMGFMFTNVVGMSLIMGFGSGAQPLISQAFGARNFPRCGDLLQRQLAIHVVLVAFLAGVWWNTEQILASLRQPPHIAALAGQFVRWRVAALPFLVLKEDLTNYLVAQSVMHFPMFASVLASLVNLAGFAVFIPRLGFVGSALAYTIANIFQALALLLFSRCALPAASAWPRWSVGNALSNWGELLRLALPSAVLMLSEWWGWEVNLFFAGLLCGKEASGGCVQLDVFPIVANTMVLCFMPNFGFSIAAGTLIGNALGANQPKKARRIACITLSIAACFGTAIALALTSLRRKWGHLFSDDAEIIDLTADVIPVVAAYVFLDQLGPGALICILRGMSIVRFPALINFVAFYAVGIPAGLWLTFRRRHEDWGIMGLWSGLVLAMAVLVSSLLVFLWCYVDWDDAARRARTSALAMDEAPETPSAKVGQIGLQLPHQSDKSMIGKPSYKVIGGDDA